MPRMGRPTDAQELDEFTIRTSPFVRRYLAKWMEANSILAGVSVEEAAARLLELTLDDLYKRGKIAKLSDAELDEWPPRARVKGGRPTKGDIPPL